MTADDLQPKLSGGLNDTGPDSGLIPDDNLPIAQQPFSRAHDAFHSLWIAPQKELVGQKESQRLAATNLARGGARQGARLENLDPGWVEAGPGEDLTAAILGQIPGDELLTLSLTLDEYQELFGARSLWQVADCRAASDPGACHAIDSDLDVVVLACDLGELLVQALRRCQWVGARLAVHQDADGGLAVEPAEAVWVSIAIDDLGDVT